jgi:hypothetical protein
LVVVVKCQPAFSSTTASVTLANAADGASTILLVKKLLILFRSASLSAQLDIVVQFRKAGTTSVLATCEGWKLVPRLLAPTTIANGHAVPQALVFDLMETYPNQVSPHGTETDTRPF